MNNEMKKYEHIYASVIFLGKNLEPQAITEALGITPYKSFKRGDIKTETEIWKQGYWELCSSTAVDSPDLSLHIKWIVDQLIIYKEKIYEILSDKTVKATISSLYIMQSSHEVLVIDVDLLEKISSLQIPLELDMYGDN
jgi:hypothetical protein